MRGCKVGGDLLASPEVHLVGCLASKGCMRDYGIVLLDVECDQFLKGSERVELMQVEPAVLEGTPPRFDQGIGEADLDLGEHPAQLSESKKVVDFLIDVLDARVGDHCGAIAVTVPVIVTTTAFPKSDHRGLAAGGERGKLREYVAALSRSQGLPCSCRDSSRSARP